MEKQHVAEKKDYYNYRQFDQCHNDRQRQQGSRENQIRSLNGTGLLQFIRELFGRRQSGYLILREHRSCEDE